MSRTIYRSYSGFCPYLQCDHQISVTFAEVNAIGMSRPGYKFIGYSCSHSEECPYPRRNRIGLCPVAEAAQKLEL